MNPHLKYQIALTLLKGVGPVLSRSLISYFGDVESIFDNSRDFRQVPKIGNRLAERISSSGMKDALDRADAEIEFIEKNNIHPIFYKDEDYPKRLLNCDDAPLLIYTKGNISLNQTKVLSIVGTRKPTDDGQTLCKKFIKQLSHKYPNILIVSGLAYGIDICAHRAALKNDLLTASVLAHGLNEIYPSIHTETAKKIINKGALITEYTSNTFPDKSNFVKRNRIIAGMADAVLVVESAAKGGALITAQIASGYNRDVLAFPGRANDPMSKGCNKLIKTNIAALIENIEDMEYVLGWESSIDNKEALQPTLFAKPETPQEKAIIDVLLVEREMNLNLLVIKTGIQVGKLSAILLELEIRGLIKSLPGGIFKLIN